MTFEEFKEFFEANKTKDEVQKLVGAAGELTEASVTEYLESDRGRPIVDRYVNKAVRSHDEKRAPEIEKQIEEARSAGKAEGEKAGSMSAEEKLMERITAMEQTIHDREATIQRNERDQEIRKIAAEYKTPAVLLDTLLENPSATVDGARARFEAYAESHKEEVNNDVNQRLQSAYKPGSGRSPEPAGDDATSGLPDDIKEAMAQFDHL